MHEVKFDHLGQRSRLCCQYTTIYSSTHYTQHVFTMKNWILKVVICIYTSFFARGQRAFKFVLKSIKEEEGGGREERRRKEKEEERKKKSEKET